MYQWIVFLHILGALAFMLAHGASVAVLLRLRSERDRERIRTLLELSGASMRGFYGSILLLLGAGIAAGFVGNWWRMWWIWLSLALFLAIAVLMYPLGSLYFRKIGNAVKLRPSGAPMASDEELDELLRSPRAALVAALGFGGVVVILWLMVLKPF
jgi:hypothetical protein